MAGDYSLHTFQLEPKDSERFMPAKVRAVISDVCTEKLTGLSYDHTQAQNLALELSNMVKLRCRTLNMPRYKLAVQTVVGELGGQGIRIASKALWNDQMDNWASFTFQSQNLFATVMVFGCYFE
jgi:hypothetical protein